MSRIAILDENNIVQNIVLGTLADFPEGIDLDDKGGLQCNIGWEWDGAIFTDPGGTAAKVIPRSEFIDRFTFDELVAIKGLIAKAVGDSPSQASLEASVFWDQVMSRDEIHLDSALASSAKIALVAWGVLTEQRANEIFL